MPSTPGPMQANRKSGSALNGCSSMSLTSSPMTSAHWSQVRSRPRRAWRRHGAQLGLADLGHWRRARQKQLAVRGCILLAASLMPPGLGKPRQLRQKKCPHHAKKISSLPRKISSSKRDSGWRTGTSSAACIAWRGCSGSKARADRSARAGGLECEVASPWWSRQITSRVSSRWPSPISPGSPTSPTPEPTKAGCT